MQLFHPKSIGKCLHLGAGFSKESGIFCTGIQIGCQQAEKFQKRVVDADLERGLGGFFFSKHMISAGQKGFHGDSDTFQGIQKF